MAERIKFYLDENISRAVTEALRQRGIDVFTAQQEDMLETTDDQHLAFAVAQRCVIITQNIDGLRWHVSGMWHKGIVYASPDASVDEMVHGLALIYASLSAEDMVGHVEFIPKHA